MDVVGELSLVLFQLRTDLMRVGMTPAHLSSEDVASLSGCPWLSLCARDVVTCVASDSLVVHLSDHLHLMRILHHELPGIASVSHRVALAPGDDLALTGSCWYLIVVFLNRR